MGTRGRAVLLTLILVQHSRGLATLPSSLARKAVARQGPSDPHRVDVTVGDWNCSSLTTGQPTPKELLYCSLASCTVATIRQFHDNSRAASSSWAMSHLEDIRVEVSESQGSDSNIVPTSLTMTIKLSGDGLTPTQKSRLIAASAFCPVKRMIALPIVVRDI